MKKLLFLLISISFISINAQKTEAKKGPIIENFGNVFQIERPDLLLEKDKEYKVIFDVYTDVSKGEKINPLLNTVARYLNMHAQQGVSKENMKVVVIMHGAAAKSTLNNEAYQKQFNSENHNYELLKALKDANIELYVCGQSYKARGFEIKDKSENIKMALSALTALIKYQSEGYQLINFN